MKRVLIVQGGWADHQPKQTTDRFGKMLSECGYEVESYGSQDCLADRDRLTQYALIIVSWTMGEIKNEYVQNISYAVARGTGLAGCHGGLCDAFRNNTDWQFMTGGQWVSHPGNGNVTYTVNIRHGSSPIVEGISDFIVCSEQYYLHVDPAIEVLASTRFPQANGYHCANKAIDMPVVWTKFWGNGRIFYCSLGHRDDLFEKSPEASLLMKRGLCWAAEGYGYAKEHHLTLERFE